MLPIRGSRALSVFRLDRLRREIGALVPDLAGLDADYWHFAELVEPLAAGEHEVLVALLRYGQSDTAPVPPGEWFIVVPRPGTISPWSSKATDIAHRCGLKRIARLERGVIWYLATKGGRALGDHERRRIARLLHDPMTETVFDVLARVENLFRHAEPAALRTVDLSRGGDAALAKANRDWGLALAADEIAYLAEQYAHLSRNPTDVELMMFAQVNSEHCRHKIFNAQWVIDGAPRAHSLFGMIRETHKHQPRETLSAYADNAAVLEGAGAARVFTDPETGAYRVEERLANILCKVETHNHPTAISPFPGAATGAGGEIRDEGATGRGAKPKAGLCGFSVSHLRLPGARRPWEDDDEHPARVATPLQIMLEGPVGAAAFNNEFGRPNITGYFRSFEQRLPGDGAGEKRGYHKPIMLAGGLGSVRPEHVLKADIPAEAPIVVLGGPAMLIGLGGGAASSVASGASAEDLDFASVQRGNAEMQRRCQEVIDRCCALGDENPILSIHDIGAGGLSNALPELVHGAGRGGRFELREVLNDEPGMSPMQIWCNEAQERYALAIAPERMAKFRDICERERCLYCVVGEATDAPHLRLSDHHFAARGAPFATPIDLDMALLFGKPPRMTRDVRHRPPATAPFDYRARKLVEVADRVLRHPAVADKTFLVTIGDRTVTGLVCRDQMVGPWQVPVADVGVTAAGYSGFAGEAMAIGERTPLALLDGPASGRMAVGEALTNLAAARVRSLDGIKLSANWMAATGHPGEDAVLFETVRAVALELCPALGISIPVGKDSMSMRTVWQDGAGATRTVAAPLSLIVSAFAPVSDVRRTLTPQLHAGDAGTLWLIDLGAGRNRLGGSILAQVYGQMGEQPPDVDDPDLLRRYLLAMQELHDDGLLRAYHDRSDGGLFVTLCEMAFAGRTGLDIRLEALEGDTLPLLFSEELGAVVQVRKGREAGFLAVLDKFELRAVCHELGAATPDGRIVFRRGENLVFESRRADLHRAWSETTWRMQTLRDDPACADEEYARILDEGDPGLHVKLTFDCAADIAAPMIARGTRPKVAILREQGVNGQVEMAAAFHRAGFEPVDVHMSDLERDRRRLDEFKGVVACGGFSFGDVLGAGSGWAKSILFNARLRDAFTAFFQRRDTFSLGVCNGCQMLSQLKPLIPGAEHWPRFERNRSEQFEARFALVEIPENPSILLDGMHGSRMPIAVAHGEGRAEFHSEGQVHKAHVALRFVDHRGRPAETYPYNPNGSPSGIAGLTTTDGRATILMPHPERVIRTVANSWAPPEWDEDGPWLRLFRNARVWVD